MNEKGTVRGAAPHPERTWVAIRGRGVRPVKTVVTRRAPRMLLALAVTMRRQLARSLSINAGPELVALSAHFIRPVNAKAVYPVFRPAE